MTRDAGMTSIEPVPARRLGFTFLLTFTMAMAAFAAAAFSVLAPFLIEDFGLTRSELGWLIAASSLGAAIVAPIIGRVADAIGGRNLAIGVFGLTVVVALSISVSSNFVMLMIVAFLAGVPNAAGNPATNKLISTHLQVGSRGLITGIKQSGVPLGIAVIGATLPPVALVFGWRVAVGVVALFALLGLIAAIIVLPADSPRSSRSSQEIVLYEQASAVRWLAAYAFLMGGGTSALQSFIPLYSQEALGYTVTAAGLALSTMNVVGVGARVLMPRLVEKAENYVAFLIAFGLVGSLATTVVLLSDHVATPLVWLGVILAGLSATASNGVVMLAAIATVHVQHIGRATGLVFFGFMAGVGLAPAAFGWVVDETGHYGVGWGASSFLFAAASLLVWFGGRRTALDTPGTKMPAV